MLLAKWHTYFPWKSLISRMHFLTMPLAILNFTIDFQVFFAFRKPSGQESWDRKANELLARRSKALDRKAGSATRNLDYMFF